MTHRIPRIADIDGQVLPADEGAIFDAGLASGGPDNQGNQALKHNNLKTKDQEDRKHHYDKPQPPKRVSAFRNESMAARLCRSLLLAVTLATFVSAAVILALVLYSKAMNLYFGLAVFLLFLQSMAGFFVALSRYQIIMLVFCIFCLFNASAITSMVLLEPSTAPDSTEPTQMEESATSPMTSMAPTSSTIIETKSDTTTLGRSTSEEEPPSKSTAVDTTAATAATDATAATAATAATDATDATDATTTTTEAPQSSTEQSSETADAEATTFNIWSFGTLKTKATKSPLEILLTFMFAQRSRHDPETAEWLATTEPMYLVAADGPYKPDYLPTVRLMLVVSACIDVLAAVSSCVLLMSLGDDLSQTRPDTDTESQYNKKHSGQQQYRAAPGNEPNRMRQSFQPPQVRLTHRAGSRLSEQANLPPENNFNFKFKSPSRVVHTSPVRRHSPPRTKLQSSLSAISLKSDGAASKVGAWQQRSKMSTAQGNVSAYKRMKSPRPTAYAYQRVHKLAEEAPSIISRLKELRATPGLEPGQRMASSDELRRALTRTGSKMDSLPGSKKTL